VCEGFKELSLEVGELLWHAHPRLHAYCNLRSSLSQLFVWCLWGGSVGFSGKALSDSHQLMTRSPQFGAWQEIVMFGRPKFSVFRAWVPPSPSRKANGDSLHPHSVPNKDEEERQVNIKLAVFFSVLALLFVLAERLGRMQERTDANLGPDSTALVSVTLSPPQRSGNRAGFSVRFRLSNMGSHSVFYPISTKTNMPIGQLVAPPTPSSDWMSLSSTVAQRVLAIQDDPNLRWIEMPPGGWANGEFSDSDDWTGDHAYAIFLKPARNADAVRILSEPYGSGRK